MAEALIKGLLRSKVCDFPFVPSFVWAIQTQIQRIDENDLLCIYLLMFCLVFVFVLSLPSLFLHKMPCFSIQNDLFGDTHCPILSLLCFVLSAIVHCCPPPPPPGVIFVVFVVLSFRCLFCVFVCLACFSFGSVGLLCLSCLVLSCLSGKWSVPALSWSCLSAAAGLFGLFVCLCLCLCLFLGLFLCLSVSVSLCLCVRALPNPHP
jgi:hypothetical protein